MAYVVSSACVGCKDTACVPVCPVDCFYEGPHTLVINPDECIDCGLCVPECPTGAIYAEEHLPEDEREWAAINRDKWSLYTNITEEKESLSHASPYSKEEAILIVKYEDL